MRMQVTAVVALTPAAWGGAGPADRARASPGPSRPPPPLRAPFGCTGLVLNPDGQMQVKEVGSCNLDGTDTNVHVLAGNEVRDQWLETAKAAGGSYAAGER